MKSWLSGWSWPGFTGLQKTSLPNLCYFHTLSLLSIAFLCSWFFESSRFGEKKQSSLWMGECRRYLSERQLGLRIPIAFIEYCCTGTTSRVKVEHSNLYQLEIVKSFLGVCQDRGENLFHPSILHPWLHPGIFTNMGFHSFTFKTSDSCSDGFQDHDPKESNVQVFIQVCGFLGDYSAGAEAMDIIKPSAWSPYTLCSSTLCSKENTSSFSYMTPVHYDHCSFQEVPAEQLRFKCEALEMKKIGC